MSNVTLSFSFPEEDKKKLQKLARDNTRTLSDYMKSKILDVEVKKIILKRRN